MGDRWQRLRVVWLYGVLAWGLAGAVLWLPAMHLSGVLGDDIERAFVGMLLFPMAGYVAGRMMLGDQRRLQLPEQVFAPEDDVSQARTVLGPAGNFYELAPTWSFATRVWWALSWRGMVVMFVSAVLGGLLGAALGSAFSEGQPLPEVTNVIAQLLGAMIGAAASVVPVRLVLGHDFGDFRLVLLGRRRKPVAPFPPIESHPQGNESSAL